MAAGLSARKRINSNLEWRWLDRHFCVGFNYAVIERPPSQIQLLELHCQHNQIDAESGQILTSCHT